MVFARMCFSHIREHGERGLAVRSQEHAPNDVEGNVTVRRGRKCHQKTVENQFVDRE